LFQESHKIYGYNEIGFMKDYHFIVTNHNYTKGFDLFIDSCTNLELGLTIMGTGNENASFPITRMNSEFSGKSSHSFGSYVQIKGNRYANKRMRISLAHVGHIPPANIFSVFTTTEGRGTLFFYQHPDKRPKVHQLKFMDIVRETSEIRRILVEINATSDYFPLKYEVYMIEAAPRVINMRTPCAILYNKALKVYENVADGSNIFYAQVNIDSEKDYWINVIVTDSLKRESSFEIPMFLEKKQKVIPPRASINFAELFRQGYLSFIAISFM
jgi:hypothetical protein